MDVPEFREALADALDAVGCGRALAREQVAALLSPPRLEDEAALFRAADGVRRSVMGDDVHLRAIVEFSSYCVRNCAYCGLRRDNRGLRRYRMSTDEIASVAARAALAGFRTIVLQSGDDLWYSANDIARIVEAVKRAADVAVTLSIGERARDEYAVMRAAGADRFLLKHETADADLYRRLHPGMSLERRLECLNDLRDLGFQVGSGCIVGLPGQDAWSLAGDIALMRELQVDMAGIGPFVPHPGTPLGASPPGDARLCLRVVAAARLVLPRAHIPATTALATVHPDGRRAALVCGANVIMPNVTPFARRRLYEIYPGSISLREPEDGGFAELAAMLAGLGRRVAATRGDSMQGR